MKKVVYKGNMDEVYFVGVAGIFKKDVPRTVTDEEWEILKGTPTIKLVHEKERKKEDK